MAYTEERKMKMKGQYEERKSNNLCVACGNPNDTYSCVRCIECLDSHRESYYRQDIRI